MISETETLSRRTGARHVKNREGERSARSQKEGLELPSLQRCGDGVRDKRHFRHQGCGFVRGIILTEWCKVVMLATQQFSNISCRARQAIVCHCNARTKRSLCAVCSLTDSGKFLFHPLFIRKSETHFQYLAGVDRDAVSQTPEVLINQGI